MTEFKGRFDGTGLRVAIVTARFNDLITSRLLAGCREALVRHGVREEDISTADVPGARERAHRARWADGRTWPTEHGGSAHDRVRRALALLARAGTTSALRTCQKRQRRERGEPP